MDALRRRVEGKPGKGLANKAEALVPSAAQGKPLECGQDRLLLDVPHVGRV